MLKLNANAKEFTSSVSGKSPVVNSIKHRVNPHCVKTFLIGRLVSVTLYERYQQRELAGEICDVK